MPFQIIRSDITSMKVDAIVNAANPSLLGGGGVDGCIHRAAGPELLAECRTLGGCQTGQAKLTGAYRLPCRYVIHTVGPVWQGGGAGEREQLISCYRSSLRLAQEQGCQTVAFPLISAGAYGYPREQAMRVAADTILAFLQEQEMTVYLTLFDRGSGQVSGRLFSNVAAYIDRCYIETEESSPRRLASMLPFAAAAGRGMDFGAVAADEAVAAEDHQDRISSLSRRLNEMDLGFSQLLLEYIDRTGKKDAEIYKRANVDRRVFSKIRSNPEYRPSRATAVAFAIALELNLEETRELLGRAGFALSHSSKFDIIVEYFIENRRYNIQEINEILFAFDQSLLGTGAGLSG